MRVERAGRGWAALEGGGGGGGGRGERQRGRRCRACMRRDARVRTLTHDPASPQSTQSLFSPHVRVWAIGHMHYNYAFERSGTRVISNQKGYGGNLTDTSR